MNMTTGFWEKGGHHGVISEDRLISVEHSLDLLEQEVRVLALSAADNLKPVVAAAATPLLYGAIGLAGLVGVLPERVSRIKPIRKILLTITEGALLLTACNLLTKATPVTTQEPSSAALPVVPKETEPPVSVEPSPFPTPDVVHSNLITKEPPTVEAPNSPILYNLPKSINELDLSARGGNAEQLIELIRQQTTYEKELPSGEKVKTSSIDEMMSAWILKLLRGGDLGSAATYDEAVKAFNDKYEWIPTETNSYWAVQPKDKKTKEIIMAVNNEGIPYLTGIAVGVDESAWTYMFIDKGENGVDEWLTNNLKGTVASVIVVDAKGNPIAWMDPATGSMKLESPVSVPAGFENAPQEAKDLIGKEGIAIDDTTIYEVATGKVLFQKFGNEFVDTRLGLPLNEKDGLAHELYFQNGAAAYEYMFTEGNIIQNDRSVLQQFRYNAADDESLKNLFLSSNLAYLGNEKYGHMSVYVGDTNNFGMVTHAFFTYNDTDQIVTLLQYRSKDDDRIHYLFVNGDVNYLEDSSEYQLRK